MTSPLLVIDKLEIEFPSIRPAVNGISLTVEEGEVVALVGESGSGKSMTARAILGLLPRGAKADGSIRLRGREILGVPDDELDNVRGVDVAMVFQEPQTALNPVRTVGWQIIEALRAHSRISKPAATARAVELLTEVEIPEPQRRIGYYPHQLSGGQKQRVVLALALANHPALLLADEPTTALDVTVQKEILALLRRLRDRTGTAILLITHNMGVVAEMADRVVVLRNGDVVETAETASLFHSPEHAYTRQLLDAVLKLPEPSDGIHIAADADESRLAGAALAFDDVSIVYPGRHGQPAFPAVSHVSLGVAPAEILGLVGESGSGKTTLGRAAAGLVPVSGGEVRVEGENLARISASRLRQIRRDLAFVHQDPAASLDPLFTVGQSIREPLDIHRAGDRRTRDQRVSDLLDAVRLPGSFATRLPRELSGGQRQRVALARALAMRPGLLIADEPTSALDVSVQAEILELFSELQREFGFACLFISHDLAVVHEISDRVAVLREGEVIESGPVATVFANPRQEYTRNLINAVPIADPSARHASTRGAAVRNLAS
jgi:peptide/nickel transport system ATP-binding protein